MTSKFSRILCASAAALALSTASYGVASAEELSLSANVTLATDYSFRGISQTDLDPAIQGGFDLGYGIFYAGTWASNVSFGGGTEIDLYAGLAPSLNGMDLDFGIIGYFYPSASDSAAELDYFELYAGASHDFGPFVAGLSFAYSPEYTGETDAFFYVNGSVSVPVGPFSVDGAVGYNMFEDADAFFAYVDAEDYFDWSLGVSYSYEQFTGTVAYVGTDIDEDQCFGGSPDICGDRVILSLSAGF